MTVFKVIIEPAAVSDLRGIVRYIKETLKEPVTAKRIYRTLKEQIITLDKLPLRHPLLYEEEFAMRGLRKAPAENYLVFYAVDEAPREVHILRILYNRREWQNFL
jgi:plasmid stabilization system protein ParE